MVYHVLFIPVTCRVKGYIRFVEKYVTGRRKRFRLYKVYIFLIRINSRVDLAMSVCPYERRDHILISLVNLYRLKKKNFATP